MCRTFPTPSPTPSSHTTVGSSAHRTFRPQTTRQTHYPKCPFHPFVPPLSRSFQSSFLISYAACCIWFFLSHISSPSFLFCLSLLSLPLTILSYSHPNSQFPTPLPLFPLRLSLPLTPSYRPLVIPSPQPRLLQFLTPVRHRVTTQELQFPHYLRITRSTIDTRIPSRLVPSNHCHRVLVYGRH